MSSSTPHLHAAQRRISWVVPVNAPSTRTATWLFARGSLLLGSKAEAPRCCPLRALAATFTLLLSGSGDQRTHAAHCAPHGSRDPSGRVASWRGTGPATAGGSGGGPAGAS